MALLQLLQPVLNTGLLPLHQILVLRLVTYHGTGCQLVKSLRHSVELSLKYPIIMKDISNIFQLKGADELNGRTPIQWLLEVSITPF